MPRSVLLSERGLVRQLRAVARACGGTLRASDLDREVRAAARLHFGSLRTARTAAGIATPSRRTWTDAKILGELRRLHRAGVTISKPALAKAGHDGLAMAAHKHLGGMRRARQLAGVPEPRHFSHQREDWDADRVIAEIQACARQGKSVAFSRVSLRLRLSGRRYFGSWSEAVVAAGLDYDAVRLTRRPYTREEVICLLREAAKAWPSLTRVALARDHAPLFKATLALFGTIDRALGVARLRSWPRAQYEHWTAARILRELHRHQRAGSELPGKLIAAASAVFGSVSGARRAVHEMNLAGAPTRSQRPSSGARRRPEENIRAHRAATRADRERTRSKVKRGKGRRVEKS